MAITIDVKPDLSRFREATIDEVAKALQHRPCSFEDAQVIAEGLLNQFVVLPR
jgi:hypothetical protein